MNFNYDLFYIFKLVAYHNSISRAAIELCITQPSVSKAIKKLENELQTTLFIREKKGMKLTDAGKTIYNYILEPINTLTNTVQLAKSINEIDNGNLKIGASLSATKYLLEDAIYTFKKLYPHVLITIKNSNPMTLYNEFKQGNLDIIFVNSTFKVNKSYKIKKICEIEDCFFCSKNYYEKIKNIDNIDKFIFKNIIIQNNGFDTRNYFASNYLKNNIKFTPILEVDRNNILVDFVLKDMGVGFATKQFIQEYIDNDSIKILKTNLKIEKRYIKEVYKDDDNKKVNKFLSILENTIKDN